MTNPVYSVVVPVFNGEQSLKELFEGIKNVFDEIKETFEVVFVDDNSRDGSWEVLKQLKKQFQGSVTAIKLGKNFGQHNAILCGFNFVKGDFIITIDSDLQTPPGEIKKLVTSFVNSPVDVVYGISGKKEHSFLRNMGSRSLKRSAKFLHNTPGEGSSFRLLTSDLVKKIINHLQHFIFIDEVILWYTDDLSFVEVEHLKRKYERSGYSLRKLIIMMSNIIIYYTTIPLSLLVYGGLIFSLITLGFGIYFMFRRFFLDVPVPGYTSLIVAILFSTSLLLFSLGMIGEYLRRIYLALNRKPPFSIKKIL